jgi:replication initiation and membrane attachment protein
MKSIKLDDFLSFETSSLLNEVDTDLLIELYQPFIGIQAVSVYLTIKQLVKNKDFNEVITYQQLLMMTMANDFQIASARKVLEAIGLLRTYHQQFKDSHIFTWMLYPPKLPELFFADPILQGLLRQYTNEKYIKVLQKKYLLTSDDLGEEISSSFSEVFHPDLNHPVFMTKDQPAMKGRAMHDIRKEFDRILFAQHLKQLGHMSMEQFSSQVLEQLIGIAQLSGVDEYALAEAMIPSFSPMDGTIDLDSVTQLLINERKLPFVKQRIQQKKILQGTGDKQQAVNLMEQLNPVDYLQHKQNGHEPSLPDIKLVRSLALDMRLAHPAINALVHHVLETKNNTLPRSYTEKLASSISREGLTHAIDVLDYFAKINDQSSSKKIKVNQGTPAKPMNNQDDDLEALEASIKHLK